MEGFCSGCNRCDRLEAFVSRRFRQQDRMGRDIKKSGKAPKRVRAFFSSKEHELSEEWFDGAELIAVLGEVNYDLTKATIEKD